MSERGPRFRVAAYPRWFRRPLLVIEVGYRFPLGISSELAGTWGWYPAKVEDLDVFPDLCRALEDREQSG